MELNKVICGDSLEYMRSLPDKCIDLVLTDPPYGINADKGVGGFGSSGHKAKKYNDNWDNFTPTQEYFDEILRIGKQVIVFGGQFFTDKLPMNGHWIVWDKVGEIQFDNPFGKCELAWTNLNKVSVNKYTVIQQGFVSLEKKRYHPTQKPVQLFRCILEDYSKSGDIVLDCFGGSGTTAIACIETGRNYIVVEKEPKYCDIIENRIKSTTLPLFVI